MGLFDKFKKKRDEENSEEEKSGAGGFIGFVLLPEYKFNWQNLWNTLREDWQIEPDESEKDEDEDRHVISYKGCTILLALMDMPVPNNEAAENAAYNYLWKEAVEKTKEHKAHLIVSVLGTGVPPKERGRLFVQVAQACCKQEDVIGIYTNGVVYEPRFYVEAADMLKTEELPILNWVWFGIYQTKKGVGGYTFGMRNFGKDEIEVLDTAVTPKEMSEFLMDLAVYVLDEDVVLRDGETIGFSAEQKLPIKKSKGVAVEGMSLKIEYGKA